MKQYGRDESTIHLIYIIYREEGERRKVSNKLWAMRFSFPFYSPLVHQANAVTFPFDKLVYSEIMTRNLCQVARRKVA